MTDQLFLSELTGFIQGELQDAAYYKLLAQVSPTPYQTQLLLELANDETEHADSLIRLYRKLSGKRFSPKELMQHRLDADYALNIKRRIVCETEDYRKYCHAFREAKNQEIRNLFLRLKTDEIIHSIRLLNLG